jgi:hypothetical protein
VPFKPGISGNPAGRPKGSKDRRTLLFEELVPHGGEIVSKAVSLALEGDQQMLALCLHKLVPNPKPVERATRIEDFTGSLTERGEQVIDAVSTGQITPTEGNALLGALSTQAKLAEHEDLVERIEKLEDAAARTTQ